LVAASTGGKSSTSVPDQSRMRLRMTAMGKKRGNIKLAQVGRLPKTKFADRAGKIQEKYSIE
jgi:hypothetical protein